jgi:hypothetical protein
MILQSILLFMVNFLQKVDVCLEGVIEGVILSWSTSLSQVSMIVHLQKQQ